MANPELQKLQQQLRKEIQTHQILVVKVQANPNDPDLKRSIAEQQVKIATLSEKQKKVVEQLRSQLGIKKSSPQNEKKANATMPLGTSQHINIPARSNTKSTPRTHPASTTPGPLTPPRMSILTNKPSMFPIKVPQITCRLTVGNTEKKITLTKLDMSDKKTVKFKDHKNVSHTKPKKALTPEEMKLEFMAALGLITQRALAHLQNKRQERKRRSTANPQFSSYNRKELESRQSASSYIAATAGSKEWLHDTQKRSRFSPPEPVTPVLPQPAKSPVMITKANGRPEVSFHLLTPSEIMSPKPQVHEGICIICHRSGELLCCNTCRLAYHTHCLDPPITAKPAGQWCCPQCKLRSSRAGDWKGTLGVVQSYLAYKKRKEEEQRKLVQKASDLRNERLALEERVKQLNEAITRKKLNSEELMKSYQRSENAVLKIKEIMSHINA